MPAEATHAALFWQDSDGKEHVTVLNRDRMTIGRQDSDIEIRDPAISRNHACIDRFDGGYRLTDTKSKQGTFVNGEEINSHVLKFGDQIELAKKRYVLQFGSADGPRPKDHTDVIERSITDVQQKLISDSSILGKVSHILEFRYR